MGIYAATQRKTIAHERIEREEREKRVIRLLFEFLCEEGGGGVMMMTH